MVILVPVTVYFLTAAALVVINIYRPKARYTWLVATGGSLLGAVSVWLWLAQLPAEFNLPAWISVGPEASLSLRVTGATFSYAAAITGLAVAVILTAVSRPFQSNAYAWAGTLTLCGLGLLAVAAGNPITLLLIWSAIDLTELIVQLRFVSGPENNEKAVTAFATRVIGGGLLIWGGMMNIAAGNGINFTPISAGAFPYFIAAVGLRLGVIPLHLPFSSKDVLRRGFGTTLRLVSAASSLVVLVHTPASDFRSIFSYVLFLLAAVAAVYGGWMWLRAPDDLSGRPFWIIGMAALSLINALSGNAPGSVAWGCAIVLVGGALFLAGLQHVWVSRALLLGLFGLSSLPFSLTGSSWLHLPGVLIPVVAFAQALLAAGFARQAMRPGEREKLEDQPNSTKTIYLAGLAVLLVYQLILGVSGWDGAAQVGAWSQSIAVLVLIAGLVWAAPRVRALNPVRGQWAANSSLRFERVYGLLWGVYRLLGRVGQYVIDTLEGEGGVMWVLLYLIIFVSLATGGTP